jgi:hypothetical protein
MRTKDSPGRRFSEWLVRAFETPATSVVPPIRDYPVPMHRGRGMARAR